MRDVYVLHVRHLSLRSLRLPLVLGLERLDGRLLRFQPLRIQLLQKLGQVRSGQGYHNHNMFACAIHLHGFPLSRDLALPPTRKLLRTPHTYIQYFHTK